jgi:hypothetical protein
MIFTEQKSINLYSTILGQTPKGQADALVKVGGESLTKFVPNINASKWNDECWLNINNKAVTVKAETQEFKDGKIDLIVGNDCHRYYIDANGYMNYDIIFSTQPKPEIFFDLQFSRGLEFFYQPELTQDEVNVGFNRPENVVGAYVYYHPKRNNKYQTGQMGIIYRPKFIDAKGNWTWGIQEINGNIWSIRVEEEWLRKANYPVRLDPSIGYSTVGDSNYGINTRVYGYQDITDGSGGVTKTYHAAFSAIGADTEVKVGISNCNQTTGSPVSSTIVEQTLMAASVSNNVTVDAVGTSLSASTKYVVVWIPADSNTKMKYNTTSTTGWVVIDRTYSTQIKTETLYQTSAVSFSMWVDYEVAASGHPTIKRFGGVPYASLNKGVW